VIDAKEAAVEINRWLLFSFPEFFILRPNFSQKTTKLKTNNTSLLLFFSSFSFLPYKEKSNKRELASPPYWISYLKGLLSALVPSPKGLLCAYTSGQRLARRLHAEQAQRSIRRRSGPTRRSGARRAQPSPRKRKNRSLLGLRQQKIAFKSKKRQKNSLLWRKSIFKKSALRLFHDST